MAKKEQPEQAQTLEDFLLSQLDQPVILKEGGQAMGPDGKPLTKQQAIAMNLLNQAMKGDIKAGTPPFFMPILAKNISIFKKMQENARKICIYQIKAVPLHRQKQNGEADNRQDAAFFIVLV